MIGEVLRKVDVSDNGKCRGNAATNIRLDTNVVFLSCEKLGIANIFAGHNFSSVECALESAPPEIM